jgi:hypothetical protein
VEKLALAYRLCIARFARKVQLAISHCEKVEPKRQRKLATSIRQNMPQGSTEHRSSNALANGLCEQGYRLGIGL